MTNHIISLVKKEYIHITVNKHIQTGQRTQIEKMESELVANY
jgi:hypothetical protein